MARRLARAAEKLKAFRLFLQREGYLGEQDGREHQDTADVFAGREPVAEYHGAREHGKHRLKAQQYRNDCRIRPLEREDLESVRNAARENADIQHRPDALRDAGKARALKERHADGGHCRCSG